jgi:hypothetical protein
MNFARRLGGMDQSAAFRSFPDPLQRSNYSA